MGDLLEQRRTEVLTTFESRLDALGATFDGHPGQRERARVVAGQILDNVIGALRAGLPDAADLTTAGPVWPADTGAAAEPDHPRTDSVLAASELHDLMVATLMECRACLPRRPSSAISLNQALIRFVRVQTLAYRRTLVADDLPAPDSERQRLARELHDVVGTGLSVAHRQLDLYTIYKDRDPAAAATRVDRAQEAVRQAMDNVRQVTRELDLPSPVTDLEQALRGYVDTGTPTGAAVDIEVIGDKARMPSRVAREVFLILREALRNALRHAHPGKVSARIHIADGEMRAVVADNGTGFDVPQALGTGAGLRSMRERTRLLGGHFEQISSTSCGTRVEISIPLSGVKDAG